MPNRKAKDKKRTRRNKNDELRRNGRTPGQIARQKRRKSK